MTPPELDDSDLLIGRAHPVEEEDILDERDDDKRHTISGELIDDEPHPDPDDPEYEDEIYEMRT